MIHLEAPVERLVCHVRNIAAVQGLSFHYGTWIEGSDERVTFRLIGMTDRDTMPKWLRFLRRVFLGGDYEVVVIEPKPSTYDITVYDMTDDGRARAGALEAFAAFTKALTKQPLVNVALRFNSGIPLM